MSSLPFPSIASISAIHASYLPITASIPGRSLSGSLRFSTSARSLSPCGVGQIIGSQPQGKTPREPASGTARFHRDAPSHPRIRRGYEAPACRKDPPRDAPRGRQAGVIVGDFIHRAEMTSCGENCPAHGKGFVRTRSAMSRPPWGRDVRSRGVAAKMSCRIMDAERIRDGAGRPRAGGRVWRLALLSSTRPTG